MDDIVITSAAWYDENGIDLIAGDPVARSIARAKIVTAASGRTRAV